MTTVVSLCVIRIELYNQEHSRDMENEHAANTNRGQRLVKPIRVESYGHDRSQLPPLFSKLDISEEDKLASVKANNDVRDANTKSNSTKKRGGRKSRYDAVEFKDDTLTFVSGNPFVEITKGILHLYKESSLVDIDYSGFDCTVICILAVPATMSCSNLLSYTAACHNNIKHIRVIRDGSVNQYMALIYFRAKESTVEFYKTYNGAPFNSLEPEYICQLVFVSRVEIISAGDECDSLPPEGLIELPTCPVCLERMDESVDGILTILCNHSFHSNCLVKWGDASCPVCRFVQTPEVVAENKCMGCKSSDSLWICLICGHVGCGRYVEGHAYQHYAETSHCYSMQLGNNRVWDYIGDNFVHRLFQNRADGKLVEGPGSLKTEEKNCDLNEKLDSVQLEYTYLLTSQLESQRVFYEDKLARVRRNKCVDSEQIKETDDERLQTAKKNIQELERNVVNARREKHIVEKKLNQVSSKLMNVQNQLAEEKLLSSTFQQNQSEWQNKFDALEKDFVTYKEEKEKELSELKDQLRDIMFYLEAEKSIAKSSHSEEIAGGSVIVGEAKGSNKKNKKKARK